MTTSSASLDNTVQRSSEWNIFTILMALVHNPKQVLEAVTTQKITFKSIILISGVYSILCGSVFSLISVQTPLPTMHLTVEQSCLRFVFILFTVSVLLIPFACFFWAMLHRYAAWFWNVGTGFKSYFALSGLGIGYYVWLFGLSLPLFALNMAHTLSGEIVLFALNMGALFYSLRLMACVGSVVSGYSAKKSWGIALSPIALLIVLWGVLMLLTIFSVRGHGA